jgi:hypothetical protein
MSFCWTDNSVSSRNGDNRNFDRFSAKSASSCILFSFINAYVMLLRVARLVCIVKVAPSLFIALTAGT